MGDAAQDVADTKEAGENVKNQSRWCGGWIHVVDPVDD